MVHFWDDDMSIGFGFDTHDPLSIFKFGGWTGCWTDMAWSTQFRTKDYLPFIHALERFEDDRKELQRDCFHLDVVPAFHHPRHYCWAPGDVPRALRLAQFALLMDNPNIATYFSELNPLRIPEEDNQWIVKTVLDYRGVDLEETKEFVSFNTIDLKARISPGKRTEPIDVRVVGCHPLHLWTNAFMLRRDPELGGRMMHFPDPRDRRRSPIFPSHSKPSCSWLDLNFP